jgi:Flp pilus assembly pilin Flp
VPARAPALQAAFFFSCARLVKAPMLNKTLYFLRDSRGQGLVEYALILALITVVAVTALAFFGQRNNNSLSNSVNQLPG